MPQKKKNISQQSLSQSLFRRRANKIESDSRRKVTDADNARTLNDATSKSEPEACESDDSFDIFVPKKNLHPRSFSSQPQSNQVLKKSKYFNESGELTIPKVVKDDDVELALAVSLQESKGIVVPLNQIKTGRGLQPKGQQKRRTQWVLMQRSVAERKKIISEKVATVLAEANKLAKPALCYSDDSICVVSSLLRNHLNELKTLWNLSQADLSSSSASTYIINPLLKYENTEITEFPNNLITNRLCLGVNDNDVASLHHASSSEDLFADSGEDSIPPPSPKRICQDTSKIMNYDSVPLTSNNNWEQSCSRLENSQDRILIDGCQDIETIEASSPVKNDKVQSSNGSHFGRNIYKAVDRLNVSVGQSSSFPHYLRLSSDLSSLATSSSSNVWSVKNGDKTIFAHSCVLRARCPLLADELENCHEFLNSYSFRVCDALFRYIYSADVAQAKLLEGCDKEQLLQLALNFNLDLLVDELLSEDPRATSVDCRVDIDGQLSKAKKSLPSASSGEEDMQLESNEEINTSRVISGKINSTLNPGPQVHHVISLVSDSSEPDVPTKKEYPPKFQCLSEDEELDFYLKDGVRLSDKEPFKVQECQKLLAHGSTDSICAASTPNTQAYRPKKLRDQFFEDSFPLLESIDAKENSNSVQGRNSDSNPIIEENGSPKSAHHSAVHLQPKKSTDRYFEDSFPLPANLSAILNSQHPLAGKSDDDEKYIQPSSSNSAPGGQIVDCLTPGRQLIVSEQASPLPNYDLMLSPQLKEELDKYGIKKGIGRNKAITLLRYIYDQIHPPADHPAVAKAISDITKSNKPDSEHLSNSDNDVHSLPSDSSEDEQMFQDMGDVVSSQVQSDLSDAALQNIGLLQQVGLFIKSNTQLYKAILKYEPISLNKFHIAIKDVGIKCNKNQLMDALDELCITFRTEKTEKQLQQKRTKKARKRKQ